jgi:hypothetical protein
MKSSRLARLGRLLVALLSVFALGAVVVASAQAVPTEGPFWKVGGNRLKANETREITVKAFEGTTNPIKLEAELFGIKAKVECQDASVAKGSFFAGGAPATSREIAEFSVCKVVNNGEGCKVKEPIKTEPVRNELVYNDETATKTAGEKILVEFDPEAGTEAKFVTLLFEGAKCLVKETEVGKGLVVGSAFTDPTTDGGKEEQIVPATAEQTSTLVVFPDAEKSVFLLKGTTLELVNITPYKAFGNEAKLTGKVLVELTSKEKYGVES